MQIPPSAHESDGVMAVDAVEADELPVAFVAIAVNV
jgi:hypothetical protein